MMWKLPLQTQLLKRSKMRKMMKEAAGLVLNNQNLAELNVGAAKSSLLTARSGLAKLSPSRKVASSTSSTSIVFDSFLKVRSEMNIIKAIDELHGIELIPNNLRNQISSLIDDTLQKIQKPKSKPKPKTKAKQSILPQATAKSRVTSLKTSGLPTLKILFTNADQLTASKMVELLKRIESEKPHIVAVCEVKRKNLDTLSETDYKIPGYTLHPVNLDNEIGRGIAVFTIAALDKSVIQIDSNLNFEEVCLLEVRLRGGDVLLFACVYRSPTPSDSSAKNNANLNSLLTCISNKNYSHKCLVGDFNYKDINWKTWTTPNNEFSDDSKFIEALRDSFLHQHVVKPTRRRGTDEPSLLDLVLTNEAMQVSEVKHTPPLGKSDHDALIFEFHCYVDYTKSKDRYNFSKGNYLDMRKDLSTSNWFEQYQRLASNENTKPEDLWQALKSKILDLRNQYVPLEAGSSKPTWKSKGSIPIDKETRQAIKLKEKAHRAWMLDVKKGGEDHKANYTKARNKVKTLLRKTKRRFERGIAMEAKSNPRAFWGHTRRYLKTKAGIAPLLEDPEDKNSMKFDDKEKASILLKQFSSVFTHEASDEIPRIDNRTQTTIDDLRITVEMVLKELMKIKPNKSCGPDQLHPRLLIELSDLLALPISILYNATLQHGVLPHDWRRAFITPIYKNKGSRHLPENYRPISLTAILSKIMEKFIRDKLVEHLLDENLLSTKQYGFISGRSTTTQLLFYLDECIKIITDGGVVDSIYLDFSKAFDTVPHRRLIGKLEAYGIRGNLLNWISAFLQNRTQEVVVNGSKSVASQVISGIPQGTVLGPILFVVYINDLLDSITSDGFMFADDTKIFRRITTRDDALKLQEDIGKLEDWSNVWQLHFNHDKCHVLTMGKFENIQHAHRYVVYNNEIDHVFEEKDLGVTIDSDLRFEEHIARKIRVANALVGQIRRSFSYLDCDSFRRIYTAFVRPHLEFAQTVWSPYLVKHINALENVQLRATKLVDGLAKLDYQERLKRLNLPTLLFRRRRGDMIEMYKHFKKYDKSTLSPSFKPRTRFPSRKHRYQLHPPPTKEGKLGIQSNFFYHRVAEKWNDLPNFVVDADNINTFKNRLDNFWEDDLQKYNHLATVTADETEDD